MRILFASVYTLLSLQPLMAAPRLVGKDGNYVISQFISTTPKHAWIILSDFKSQSEWAPDIIESKVSAVNTTTLLLSQVYRAPYTFGLDIRATLRVTTTQPHGFKYHLVKGDRLKKLQGKWTILPVKAGIKLVHTVSVEPEMPDFLKSIYYSKQEKNFIKWMTILKNRMEKS